MDSAHSFKKRDLIGNWKLDKRLGQGGQGVVWKACHAQEKHCPLAAVKICTAADTKARARFSQEVELLSAQSCPNIISVRERGSHHGVPFFVMELATTTLERVVTENSPGIRVLRESPALLLDLFKQACGAIAHLHGRQVLHRDIKPSNILLFLDSREPIRALVADLGIATTETKQGALTATHEVVGTPTYRAPESTVPGCRHTPASDVYSLGKTLEFLFNRGTPPNLGPGKCLRSERLSTQLWDALDRILQRACAFEPGDRYSDASVLVEALPNVVLATVDSSSASNEPLAKIAVTSQEVKILSTLIAACPTAGHWVDSDILAKRTYLPDLEFSMALRQLLNLEFVEYRRRQRENEFGGWTTWQELRPTSAAFDWARAHRDEIEQAQPDDDIPF